MRFRLAVTMLLAGIVLSLPTPALAQRHPVTSAAKAPTSLADQIQIYNLDGGDAAFHQQYPNGKLMQPTGPVWSGYEPMSGSGAATPKWLYIYQWIDGSAVDNSIALELWAKPGGGYTGILYPMDVGVQWRVVLPSGYTFTWSDAQGMAFFDV